MKKLTPILIVLILPLMLGCHMFKSSSGRSNNASLEIKCDARYKAVVRKALADVESKLGMKYKGEEIHMHTQLMAGVSDKTGLMYYYSEKHGIIIAGDSWYTGRGGYFRVARKPDGATQYRTIAHEIAHLILRSNGFTDLKEMHRIMTEAGVY